MRSKYDDMNPALLYSANWVTYTLEGPYAGTLHNAISYHSSVQFNFTGEQFRVTYSEMDSRGSVDVYIDGVKATSIDQYGPGSWQQVWTSVMLPSGIHTVRLVLAGTGVIDIDAIEIISTATILPAGKYDDGNPALLYSANWVSYTLDGPYGGTLHNAISYQSSVQFHFTGEQFRLTYLEMNNRGMVDVYIDGAKATSIDQSGSGNWQQAWTSDPLPSGTHTVRLVLAGIGVIDIDAIEVLQQRVLHVPINAGEERRINTAPVHEDEELVGKEIVEPARTDGPGNRIDPRHLQAWCQSKGLGDGRGAGAPDVLLGDDRDGRRGMRKLLRLLGDRSDLEVDQFNEADLG